MEEQQQQENSNVFRWQYLAIVGGLIVVIVGLLIAFLIGRSISPPSAPPTDTPRTRFATATPTPEGGAAHPSPTLTPTPIMPLPTDTPTGTPISPTPSATFTPVVVTPTYTPSPYSPRTTPTPYARIDSPSGFLNVRYGPGRAYEPPLGTYNNGAIVSVIGKQYSQEGELWWMIRFEASPNDKGWVYANYTQAQNVDTVPWVTAPPLPPTTPTPYPIPTSLPHAIINSPQEFIYVRSGPGRMYEPPLGSYENGEIVEIIGKQYSSQNEIWWQIPFGPRYGDNGWIDSRYTIAKNTNQVPWVTAPPTPTATAPSPTPTRPGPPVVEWTITGRVVRLGTSQPITNAIIIARLGQDGTAMTAPTDNNGQFIITGQARDIGDLNLNVTADGYLQENFSVGPNASRVYNFPNLELRPLAAPRVTWAIFGRVTEVGPNSPIPNAQVEARLGTEGVTLQATTDGNGEFSLNGEARDEGQLALTITADGYQRLDFTSDQTSSRIYNLPNMQLVPQTSGCSYESVINMSEASAVARLQNLGFADITINPVPLQDSPELVGYVVGQEPEPPPEGEARSVSCQIPIILDVGIGTEIEPE